jgi:hypothetical protein
VTGSTRWPAQPEELPAEVFFPDLSPPEEDPPEEEDESDEPGEPEDDPESDGVEDCESEPGETEEPPDSLAAAAACLALLAERVP